PIAFSEGVVSPGNAKPLQNFTGMQGVSGGPTALDSLVSAAADPTNIRNGINACTTAWKASGTNFQFQRGSSWAHGGFAHTLFNSIVTPNSKQAIWSYCDHYSSSEVGTFGNASSYHPGGVNTLFADGSVRF